MSAFGLRQRVNPVLNVLSDLILREPIALLNYSFELIATACDSVQIVVGQIAPFLFDLSFLASSFLRLDPNP
jgi:hypothetical protein